MTVEQQIKNPQYVINSLTNQVAMLAQEKALRDAIITEQQLEIETLKKEIEELKKKDDKSAK